MGKAKPLVLIAVLTAGGAGSVRVAQAEVVIRVGDDFEGSAVPRRSGWIESFLLHDSRGPRPVPGREGWDPAGAARVEEEGLQGTCAPGAANRTNRGARSSRVAPRR